MAIVEQEGKARRMTQSRRKFERAIGGDSARQHPSIVCGSWRMQDMCLPHAGIPRIIRSQIFACSRYFLHALIVFAMPMNLLVLMQSSVMRLGLDSWELAGRWSSLYTRLTASKPSPSPPPCLDSAAKDPAHEATRQSLEAIGERYHQFRAELMVSNNEGLTSTYNRFHDPAETNSGLLELRRLHGEMDQAVLNAYGWSDVSTTCGFGLDYLDTEEDAQLPDDLQERIDSGELFFWDAGDALDFQGQLQAYGAITGRRKLPWRYRWPDSVRDDVLARLLALNAERYAEEVAMGLHSKGAAKTPKARGKGKAKAASTPEFELTSEPYQGGLSLF